MYFVSNTGNLGSRVGLTVAEQNLEFLKNLDLDQYVTHNGGLTGSLRFTFTRREGLIIDIDKEDLSPSDLERGASIGFFDIGHDSRKIARCIVPREEKEPSQYALRNLGETRRLYNS